MREELERLAVTHADTLNPLDAHGVCVYTSPDDPNRHCVAGQVIFNVTGYAIPANENGVITGWRLANHLYVHGVTLSEPAESLLAEVQRRADNADVGGRSNPVRWGEAIPAGIAQFNFLYDS